MEQLPADRAERLGSSALSRSKQERALEVIDYRTLKV